MTPELQQLLDQALANQQLNQTAYQQISRWLQEDEFAEYRDQLSQKIIQQDWPTLLDQFYRIVVFGTGGIRGVMDLGTNRINNYTIRWATQAYAAYLLAHYKEGAKKGVAIAYDSRHGSEEYMRQTASVLAGNGIPVKIFEGCRSTPELSFTVRHLGLIGGIVVTASHNPPQFNGWKVYNQQGVQVLPDEALQIEQEFTQVTQIKKIDFDQAVSDNLVSYIDPSVDQAFIDTAKSISLITDRDISIVYSPLHGVGIQNVLPALQQAGFSNIHLVEEQMTLDGDFPTVKDHFPQPEFPVVYEPAIALAKKVQADIVLVSDPDADRLGIAAPNSQGNWQVLTGNQGGAVMGAYYLNQLNEQGKLPSRGVVIKTTVTTDLVRDIAESHQVEVVGDLLVGFKFIGDRIEHLPADQKFLFGLEESIGYLFGTAYRDKGAETPAIVAAETATWLKKQHLSVPEYLESLYQEHGYYAERLYYEQIQGLGALEQMQQAMGQLRQELPKEINGQAVLKYIDRLTGQLRDGQTGQLIETRNWDKGDMLSFFFTEDERTAVHVRPSGTEPKMKYYTMVKGRLADISKVDLDQQAAAMERHIVKLFTDILKTITVDIFE